MADGAGGASGASGVGGSSGAGVGPALGADPPGPVRDVRLAVRAAVKGALATGALATGALVTGALVTGTPRAGGDDRPVVTPGRDGPPVLVGVSGGPDSLALLAATVAVADPLGVLVHAVCVDHGWHPRTAAVAVRVATAALAMGVDDVRVVRVVPRRSSVGGWAGGPEEAARTARLDALERAAARDGAVAVLLGHTLDDQAEQVLLGLARGSGARSLAGMPARRGPFVRPFLGLRRATVHAACPDLPALGLPWHDPSNLADRGSAPLRAQVRGRLLPVVADVLGDGAVTSLARSADLLREDADALDGWAGRELDALLGPRGAGPHPVEVPLEPLLGLPVAVRRRVLRELAARAGARALGLAHSRALDALVVGAGHGPVSLPGPVVAARTVGPDGCGRLTLAVDPPPREDPHGRP